MRQRTAPRRPLPAGVGEQTQAVEDLDRMQNQIYRLDEEIELKTHQLHLTRDETARRIIETDLRTLTRQRQGAIVELKRRQREVEPLLVNAILQEMKR